MVVDRHQTFFCLCMFVWVCPSGVHINVGGLFVSMGVCAPLLLLLLLTLLLSTFLIPLFSPFSFSCHSFISFFSSLYPCLLIHFKRPYGRSTLLLCPSLFHLHSSVSYTPLYPVLHLLLFLSPLLSLLLSLPTSLAYPPPLLLSHLPALNHLALWRGLGQ